MFAKTGLHTTSAQLFRARSNWLLFAMSFICGCIIVSITTSAHAAKNRIITARILSETTNEITLSIRYDYSGDKGNNIFMNAVMGDKGKPSPHYGVKPGKVAVGTHDVRVVLGVRQEAPDSFTTGELIVSMYVGRKKSFLKQSFAFSKTWMKPGASLKPMLMMLTGIKPITIPNQSGIQKPESQAAEDKRILPNGRVEIKFPNGIKKEFFKGGYTVIKPDGSAQTILYSSAQPPTPPTAPPNDQHAVWVEYEKEQLLRIISNLVDNDEESVNNYLKNEGEDRSPYDQIGARTTAIGFLLGP